MKPIAIFLHGMGMNMIVYIDDILLLGELSKPSGGPPTSLDVSVNKSGIYHQLFQVDNHTYPEDRVSGVTGGLNLPFTAHSTSGASSSAAADSGITVGDILKAADWSTESVFRKFYYQPTHDLLYSQAVLSLARSET